MDIHLLATAITAEQWNEFTREAESGGLRGVCALSLVSAVDVLRHGDADRRRNVAPQGRARSARARLSGPGSEPARAASDSDWRAIGSWKGRLRLVKDHVYPARSYMVARYGPRHPWLLPLLYGRRASPEALRRWVMQGR